MVCWLAVNPRECPGLQLRPGGRVLPLGRCRGMGGVPCTVKTRSCPCEICSVCILLRAIASSESAVLATLTLDVGSTSRVTKF